MLRFFCTSLPVTLGVGIVVALYYYFNSKSNKVRPHEYNSHIRTEYSTAFKYSTNDCCGICLEDIGGRDRNVDRLECNHIFHRDCILDILRRPYAQKLCPLCRRPINYNQMLSIQYS